MDKQINRRRYVLFGASALLAVAVIGAITVVIRFESIRADAERDAAVGVSSVLSPALGLETGDGGAADPLSFTTAARGLLSNRVRALRLWNSEGLLLAGASDSQAAEADSDAMARAARGSLETFRRSSSRGDLLVSYTSMASGVVLEVQQDYGPIAASAAGSRRTLLISAVVGGAILVFLVQILFWWTTRDLRRGYERLLYLYRTGQAIRSSLDQGDVLEQMARDAAVFTRSRLALATLVEEKTNDLILKASFDQEESTTAQHHRKVEEWFLRRSAGTGETVLAQQDTFPFGSVLGYEPEEGRPASIMCVAIAGREGAIGLLTVVRDSAKGQFSATETSMVEEMAAQAAMAVEQAVLFAKVRTYAEEVEVSYDSTLKVLMAALDTKDAATQGHSERVMRLTGALAKEMGVPRERLVDIERGALLHDVGKIGVPDEVLQKPDTLNEREWEAMRQHPLLAGLMVSKVGFLERALPILLYHHERYDGGGYPFGLEGGAIPLEARIFAVVDAYDAMTSDRPYRRAIPHAAALLEIRRNAGLQFDPQVVEAFTRLMSRMTEAEDRAA